MAKEMLPLPEELETIDVGQRVEIAVREAETRLGMLQRVMQVALKRTLPQDWVDFHGNPYLTAGGAERLRGLFAITVDNTEVKRYEDKDDRGGYFWFVVSAIAHFRDDALAVMGTCSARDQFFSTRHEGNEKILLPADQVDPTNLLKAAYSNMLTNAVTRILGIRNLTWGQLEAIGFKRGEAARVEFKPFSIRGDAPSRAAYLDADGMFRVVQDGLMGRSHTGCGAGRIAGIQVAVPAREVCARNI